MECFICKTDTPIKDGIEITRFYTKHAFGMLQIKNVFVCNDCIENEIESFKNSEAYEEGKHYKISVNQEKLEIKVET